MGVHWSPRYLVESFLAPAACVTLPAMAALLLRLREREISRAPITVTRVTIGRDTTCDLVIDNAGVSRIHAAVTFANGLYQVEDADSQNGITVNGNPVKSATLEYGDVIGIGKFEIEFVQSPDMPMETGQTFEMPKRNVMRTMQMDAGASARIRDEAIARLAAQKGLPAPPPRASTPRASAAAPVPQSDAMEVVKLAAMVLVGVGTLVGIVLYLLG
jgi:pSer/pThr/pTyr-binding forkhead associated (FHA) protein